MRFGQLLAGVAAVTLVAGCAADSAAPRVISGITSDPAPSVAGLALPDVANGGSEFSMVPPAGRWLIVYFGYTACPDVCPTTMHEVELALQQLGDTAATIDVAMATIDPDRDTDDVLTNYVTTFVPRGHALRTTDITQLDTVVKGFGGSYTITTTATGDVEVSHTPNLYLVDDTGTLVLTWPFGLPADAIATDLEILMETA